MKITLVGDEYPPYSSRGLARYIYMLGKEYGKLGHEVQLIIRRNGGIKEKWISPIYSPDFNRLTWKLYPFFLIPELLKTETDIFHANYVTTGMPLILTKRKPCVVSIHDINPLIFPEWSHPLNVQYYKFCFKVIKKADAFIVVSEYSKEEVIKHTNLPEEKIFAIYNGVDHEQFYPKEKENKEKFVFSYLGGLGRWKNVETLIKAFHELRKERENIELKVGGSGIMELELKKLVKELNVKDVVFDGFIGEEKINEFYNSSDCFVFPSYYEGFGLPVLEAMACGVPVVSSNAASLPEVCGNAAIFFNPKETNELENRMEKILIDELFRKKLIKKGIERAKEFSWEKTAKETMKVYERVLE